MKIKNKIVHYLQVSLNDDLTTRKVERNVYNVIGENKDRLVIDDSYFTSLDTVKVKRGNHQFRQLIGQFRVRDYTKDDYFRRNYGVFVIETYVYAGISEKILANRMNKALDKYIQEKVAMYAPYIRFSKSNIVLSK